MKQTYEFEIDVSGVEGPCDEGLWLGYGAIVTWGDTLDECLSNASVDLIDQDGGEWAQREADEPWMQDLIVEAYWGAVTGFKQAMHETTGDFVARCERIETLDRAAAELSDGETTVRDCYEQAARDLGMSQDLAKTAFQRWFVCEAHRAGIPISVVLGRTKLSDHFTSDYIKSKCSGGGAT